MGDGTRVTQEIFVQHGTSAVVVVWTLMKPSGPVVLRARPFLSGRDYHSMHHQNGAFSFDTDRQGAAVTFRPYDGLPGVTVLSNGEYRHAPDWYRQILYTAERERGLDDTEDLASPGEFSWPLSGPGEHAVWVFRASPAGSQEGSTANEVVTLASDARTAERRRREAFPTLLDRAVDAYWFAAVRAERSLPAIRGSPTGVATRSSRAWPVLRQRPARRRARHPGRMGWSRVRRQVAGPVSDHGEAPEFNSVDASLW